MIHYNILTVFMVNLVLNLCEIFCNIFGMNMMKTIMKTHEVHSALGESTREIVHCVAIHEHFIASDHHAPETCWRLFLLEEEIGAPRGEITLCACVVMVHPPQIQRRLFVRIRCGHESKPAVFG